VNSVKEQRIPRTYAESLRLAAELAERNEVLERQLAELRLSGDYPEVLRPAHIEKLLGVSKPIVSEWTRDPSFPILNKGRKKGEVVMVLKAELYEWLKSRRPNEVATQLEPKDLRRRSS